MLLPIQLTFRGLAPSEPISDYTRKKAEKLETFYDRITSCRIALEARTHRHHHGKPYRVRIDLTVPGHELVAGGATDDGTHDDLYAAIDDAFDDAQRVLLDFTRKRRDAERGKA